MTKMMDKIETVPKKRVKTVKEYKDTYAGLSLFALICFAATLADRIFFRKEALFEASCFDAGIALLVSFLLHFAVFLMYYFAWAASGKDDDMVFEKKRYFAAGLRGSAFLSVLWYAFCVSRKIFGFLWLII